MPQGMSGVCGAWALRAASLISGSAAGDSKLYLRVNFLRQGDEPLRESEEPSAVTF